MHAVWGGAGRGWMAGMRGREEEREGGGDDVDEAAADADDV